MLRIGNAQAFWGDRPNAPATLIAQQPNLDYITLDYLSEVSMSIMAIQREKDPSGGYAKDFIDVVRSLIPFWKKGLKFKLVANAGGLNPKGCAEACQKALAAEKCMKNIGIVFGDDVMPYIQANAANLQFNHLESGKSITALLEKLATANAYFGAAPIAQALTEGSDIVITGRLADPSLTVGPCIAHFGWKADDYNLLAGATVAGHLIECGTQVTGGVSTNWMKLHDTAQIGFPFVEMYSDGSFVITKPAGTGGVVNIETVKEQLLYEIGDPAKYLSPDCTVSFLNLKLQEEDRDRVKVSGAIGKPPTDSYKVSATYRNGFRAEATLAVFGQDAAKKARLCGEIILKRVKQSGYVLEKSHIECFGAGAIVPHVLPQSGYPQSLECFVRVAAADKRLEALECFSKEIAALVTSGPQGVTGYVSGRPRIRPVFAYWPCLIKKQQVEPCVELMGPL